MKILLKDHLIKYNDVYAWM